MTRYADHMQSTQTEQDDPRQVQNSAGGFTFQLDKWGALDRWLILGGEGGTYYIRERKLTRDRAKTVLACLDEDAKRTIDTIVEVSASGRAPKNDPAIFALALAAAHQDPAVRRYALTRMPAVCRTGTHLFQFCASVDTLRGWGRALRRGVGDWYLQKDLSKLAYQMVKYRQRGGWSHRDVLRLAHPKPQGPAFQRLLRWGVGAEGGDRKVERRVGDKRREYAYSIPEDMGLPAIVEGYLRLQSCEDPREAVKLITEYKLTHEMVPSALLGNADVWSALLAHMPMTATVRNLGRLTSLKLLTPGSAGTRLVRERLGDEERLRRARLHPLSVLVALKTYQQGKGMRGKLSWTPVGSVVDALDGAFYTAFGNVEPTGKRTMLALDVSGSMTCDTIAGMPLSPREASVAMAMVTARAEDDPHIVGFTSKGGSDYFSFSHASVLTPLNVTPRCRLDDSMRAVDGLPFGGTDCALPMLHAMKQGLEIDTFVVYTDNETWAGDVQPHTALKQYRDKTGIPAKLVVVGMTATDFTIAHPDDEGMMDVVGFDTSAPNVIADFCRR
jgi:60 kDa SS-A/Ro ribonucleoprotein